MKKRGLTKECLFCAKEFYASFAKLKRGFGKFCSHQCQYDFRRIAPHKEIHREGRVMIWAPDSSMSDKAGRVYRYRLEMARVLNRPLLHSEIIHHKNEIKSDDDPQNLRVMDNSTHQREHSAKRAAIAGYDLFTQKRCRNCHEIKSKSEFSPTVSRGRKTLNSQCKKCATNWLKEYRRRHPDRVRISSRKSYLKRKSARFESYSMSFLRP